MAIDEKTKIEIIRESIRRLEEEDWDDKEKGTKDTGPAIYDRSLEIVKNTDLRNANNLNLESIIQDFLYRWGSMGRVLGREKFEHWEPALIKQIRVCSADLEELRKKDLLHENLDRYRSVIMKLYDSFRAKVDSPIAVVKILHLICPDFFPLWDNSIANGVRAERKTDTKEKNFTAGDYYEFMKDLQAFGKKYEGTLSDLARQYKKTKLKILDEFLLWTVRNPFSFFLPAN